MENLKEELLEFIDIGTTCLIIIMICSIFYMTYLYASDSPKKIEPNDTIIQINVLDKRIETLEKRIETIDKKSKKVK